MNPKNRIRPLLLAMLAGGFLHHAGAAGRIDLVAGNVSVTSASSQLRIPREGERIEAGDVISTGTDGEMHVDMDDDALLAVRANTHLRIETYKAEGGGADSAALR